MILVISSLLELSFKECLSVSFLLQIENPPDPPDNYEGRKSPYDNVQSAPRRLPPRKRPSTLPLFIGEHTNIDDVLGDTAILRHSPVLSRVRKQERVEEGEGRMNLALFSDRCYRAYPVYMVSVELSDVSNRAQQNESGSTKLNLLCNIFPFTIGGQKNKNRYIVKIKIKIFVEN